MSPPLPRARSSIPHHAASPAEAPSSSSDHGAATPNSSGSRGNSLDGQNNPADEQSPLLSPSGYHEDGDIDGSAAQRAADDNRQTTKSVWYLILLTISIGGLQIAWSVELSNGSPYLLSLGLSKSLMALVWIAGPLTGTLVQPYVGMLSDNCRLRMGKRKPFMLGGAAATVLSLMGLAWTKEIVTGVVGLFGADPGSRGVRVAVIVCAVIGVYVLDFAINTVQAAIRAFIVDCAPAHQQEAANAMASRLTGIGNIVGYAAGYFDLPHVFWFFGNTQFKVLCAIACVALAATVVLSTSVIRERDPRLDAPPKQRRRGVLAFFFTIFKSIRRLPPQVKRVCQVQFFSWVGFFPLLFYTSSYIGEIYVEPYLEEDPHMSPDELDKLYEKATRIGTFALFVNSVVSLLTNVFLPFFIAPTYDRRPVVGPASSGFDACSMLDEEPKARLLDRLQIPGFTLKRAWLGSLVLFAFCMSCAAFVRTVQAATALIGLAGITWGMTLWAPWAIISAEISRRDALARIHKMGKCTQRADEPSLSPEQASPSSLDDGGQSWTDEESVDGEAKEEEEEEQDQAGVILGIHNMAIAAPQIIATVGSSIIFKIWQKPRGTPGDHSMAIVLALGGVFVLGSTFFVGAIKENTSALSDAVLDPERGRPRADTPSAQRAARSLSRKSSLDGLPRASQDRATLTRSRSLGSMAMH